MKVLKDILNAPAPIHPLIRRIPDATKQQRVAKRALVPGLLETARRVGRTPSHVFYVLTGQRASPHAAEYRRVNTEVLTEAGYVSPDNSKK